MTLEGALWLAPGSHHSNGTIPPNAIDISCRNGPCAVPDSRDYAKRIDSKTRHDRRRLERPLPALALGIDPFVRECCNDRMSRPLATVDASLSMPVTKDAEAFPNGYVLERYSSPTAQDIRLASCHNRACGTSTRHS